MSLTITDFARGFIAYLINQDRFSIQPKDPAQRDAILKMWIHLKHETEKARENNDLDWLKQLVRLRNSLAPGNTGAFDEFETALRNLQLSLTESPNPYYEHIVFTASKPFARSALEKFTARERSLVENAAQIFTSSISYQHAPTGR
jgi:hypothetical protein